MRLINHIASFLIICTISACENVKDSTDPKFNGESFPVQIQTEKTVYAVNDTVIIQLFNASDISAMYYKCSSVKGIPYNIYEFENNSWKFYWGPICDGFMSYCCPEFLAGTTVQDTINVFSKKGIFRFEYQFKTARNLESQSYYSNSFTIE